MAGTLAAAAFPSISPVIHFLKHVKPDEKQRKQDALKEDAIDEGPPRQPSPQPQVFGNKHDFSQNQGIEKGKPMHLVVNNAIAIRNSSRSSRLWSGKVPAGKIIHRGGSGNSDRRISGSSA